jgi:hypothetical protein
LRLEKIKFERLLGIKSSEVVFQGFWAQVMIDLIEFKLILAGFKHQSHQVMRFLGFIIIKFQFKFSRFKDFKDTLKTLFLET